jgi:diacylglycerol O-acyltransferase
MISSQGGLAGGGTMTGVLLGREDRAILDLEGPHVVGHTCKVLAVEARLAVAHLRDEIESRLPQAPMLTWRLRQSSEGPVWLPEETVDIRAHVVDAGSASSAADLRERIAGLFAEHLDRERPLWRLDAIRLPDDQLALVWRIHHALADGTSTMRLGEAVLWREAGAATRPAPQADAPRTLHGPDHPQDDLRRRRHLGAFLRREFAESLGRSPFDAEIGSRRSVAFASVPFEPLHHAARQLGATVNEAVLSVVSGALRRWLEHHHGRLGSIRLRVPVSLHQESDDPGNRDSFFTLPVSLHEADPLQRLRTIQTESSERKREHDAERMESFLELLGELSPRLRGFAERIESGPRSFALSVSNVPGPRKPIEICSASVLSMHSLAEVGRRHGLRVTVVSMAGSLGVGVCADPGIVPDIEGIADGIEAESQALLAAAVA